PNGTLLVKPPGTASVPDSSSAAKRLSVARFEPVKTPSTVSKLLPLVSIHEFGPVTLNEHGATHVHQTLLGAVPVPVPSDGSPASRVAPTFVPVAVSAPLPTIVWRFAKLSFEARTL